MTRRRVLTFALGATVVAMWLAVSTIVIVRSVLLDADTYTSSLVTTDAHARVYTEVLADPEMADVTEALLGGLGLRSATAAETRVIATNMLRLTVPPSRLRAGSDIAVAQILRYVRGDTARLTVTVPIDRIIDDIDHTAVVEARTALAARIDRAIGSTEEYSAAVRAFADELAAGRLPASVPVLAAGDFDPGAVTDAIFDALGPAASDAVRQQILAAVVVGDERDALITAASELVATHAALVADQLAGGTSDLEVVAAVAQHARQPAGAVVGSLDTVRDVAEWSRPFLAVIAAVVGALSMAALIGLHRRTPRRAAAAAGATLLAAGAVQVGVWWIASRLVPTPFDPATATGSSSWRLPAGLRTLLADIQHALTGSVLRSVTDVALIAMVPGVLLVIASVLWPRRGRRAVAVAAAIGVAGVAVGMALASPTLVRAPRVRACNGHAALCDRRYDEVVFAATHNAMSSPDVVRVWPEQDEDLGDQLDSGVRALLIDSHYWLPVRSPSQLVDVPRAIDLAEPILPAAVAAALYPDLGTLRDGREGSYLCHLQCAFGAIAFVDAMATVREFLEENPDEVVTLIIQDAISTADTEQVMHSAGLDPYLYEHRGDGSWPTLGTMIDDDRRLVVFAERSGTPPVWYANAFEHMQETPFTVRTADGFDCEPNRGRTDAALFLMNHWVARVPPDRVNATIVNQRSFIVDRARRCEEERGVGPNFVAVDFSNIGDVVGAVDDLNQIS